MSSRFTFALPGLPQLRSRLSALRARERALLFLAVLLVALLAWDDAVLQRLDGRWRFVSGELAELAGMEGSGLPDETLASLGALSERASTLNAQVEAARTQLRDRAAGLVEPRRMPNLVRDLLQARAGLTLVRLANLPPEEIRGDIAPADDTAEVGGEPDAPATDADAAAATAVAYSHGLEVVVEGRFQDIYDYIVALERQPWHLLWRTVEIEVVEHPRVRARLVVATIGVDREWLGT